MAKGWYINTMACVGAIAAPFGAALAESGTWTVSRDQLVCIVENIDAYLTATGDPLVIFVQGCPEVDPARAMTRSAENSGTFNVTGGDAVLVLTKGELACLVEFATGGDLPDPVIIPREGLCD